MALINYHIKDAIFKEREKQEQNAVERIKFRHTKSLSQVKPNIRMPINESGDVITNPKPVADMLHNKFMSVFSDVIPHR